MPSDAIPQTERFVFASLNGGLSARVAEQLPIATPALDVCVANDAASFGEALEFQGPLYLLVEGELAQYREMFDGVEVDTGNGRVCRYSQKAHCGLTVQLPQEMLGGIDPSASIVRPELEAVTSKLTWEEVHRKSGLVLPDAKGTSEGTTYGNAVPLERQLTAEDVVSIARGHIIHFMQYSLYRSRRQLDQVANTTGRASQTFYIAEYGMLIGRYFGSLDAQSREYMLCYMDGMMAGVAPQLLGKPLFPDGQHQWKVFDAGDGVWRASIL